MQARAALSTQVLFRGTPPSAPEVHWRYETAHCAMTAGYGDVPVHPQLAGSELRSASRLHMSRALGLGYAQLGNGNVLLL